MICNYILAKANDKHFRKSLLATSIACVAANGLSPLQAAEVYNKESLSIRWDNTVKYSNMFSLADRDDAHSAALAAQFRNDGYDNFDSGLASNRIDLFSELDLTYKSVGARISGAAWYDDVYHHETEQGVDFADGAIDQHGGDVEVLDAFVFGKTVLGNTHLTARLGRHALVWGESLFLATNGIAYGNGPLDLAKGLAVPNTQAKELFLPVNQFSFVIQPSLDIKFEGYYQFEWDRSRIPGAGSYFSDTNFMDEGGSLDLGYGNLARLDAEPDASGQWGLSMRYYSEALDTDFGIYYINYHEKIGNNQFTGDFFDLSSVAPVSPNTIVPASYGLWFPEDIKLYGISASTTLGTWNVAGEMSWREDTPLLSAPFTPVGGQTFGDSLHYQLSGIYAGGSGLFWDAYSLIAEIGGHRVTGFTKNEANRWPDLSREALGLRVQFIPEIFQVRSGLDIKLPISVGHNIKGYSALDPKFNGGSGDGAGDITLGAEFTYQGVWRGGVSMTHYYGSNTGEQALIDRDFISFNINRTF